MRTLQPNLRGVNIKLARLLQTVIALELLNSSKNIYLNVRELNDTLILPNAAGEFSAVLPEMGLEIFSLTQVLIIFATRGTQIFIRHRMPISSIMHSKLIHSNIQIKQSADIYPPGWIGDKYTISGTIKFLRDQVGLDENEVTFLTTEHEVHTTIMNAQANW